ncbi:MAG: leucine--tRNA ligase [Candidatus Nitrosocosmicus sp.]
MPSKSSNNSNQNNIFNKNSEILWDLIEEKWINYWNKNKINNSDIEYSKQKFFITVAYPYPNSPQHIGHGRTYTLADVHARYYKLKGFNVLFPMGFHYTGTPILGMSKRVQSKDKEIIDNFKNIFLIDQNTIDSFVDPLNIAKYFHNEIKSGMVEMGYSIDWRREFTTIDTIYKKFISWQFKTLLELGVIEQGSHPVGWCPNDENPVSQHDTLGDIEPSFTEYNLIKFKLKDEEIFLPVATLRPETIFGVTNLWINDKETYFNIIINNKEKWIVSKSGSKKLEFQNYDIKVISEFNGSEFVGRLVENPITNSLIPVLPASFVTMDDGSGIVMSVPAHAPFDMQALYDIKKSNNALIKKINLEDINPITIINSNFTKIESEIKEADVKKNGNENQELIIPSSIFLEKYSIKDQTDPNLEKATSDLYNFEFYNGIMNDRTPYSGIHVSKAKEKIKQTLLKSTNSIIFYELTNKPVFCRCGTLCYVKILNNQWFLNYGNAKWKALALKCLRQMDIVPNEIIGEFENVFDWLKERACARKSGLGTPLPWDKEWIIESLSDSVIYMIYYIISKYVNTKNLEDYNNLIDETFFDYILYNKKNKNFKNLKDDGSFISENEFYKNNDEIHDINYLKSFLNLSFEIKKEFEYYYPLDCRHSGRDLIPNHLSFFIFNHSILFPQKLWPKQIVVNGSVLMDGKKMSKSMGNIIPLRNVIKQYSADSIRVAMLVLGELLQDVDFSFSILKGIYSKLNEIYNFYNSFYKDNKITIENNLNIDSEKKFFENENLDMEDKWLLTRINRNISDITYSFDKLKIREALNTALYLMDKDFDWYKKRKFAKTSRLYHNRKDVFIIYQYLIKRVKILSPFCPFLSEEIWHMFGNNNSIFTDTWPSVAKNQRNDDINEENEQFIVNILNDLNKIIKITKNASINKIFLYLSSEDKNYLYYEILKLIINSQNKNKNFGEVMKSLLSDSSSGDIKIQNIIKNNTEFIKKTIDDILSLAPGERERRCNIGRFDDFKPLEDAISLLSSEYKIPSENILIYKEDQKEIMDPNKKSKFSRPFKPAIFIQ